MMNWDLPPLINKYQNYYRKKFSPDEDAKLKELVQKFGAKQWDQIALMMPGRTGRQCRDRYRNYLIPGYFNGQWSEEEDNILRKKFSEMGPQWAKMTKFFRGRSANSIKNRWNYFLCRMPIDASEPTSVIPQEAKKNEMPQYEINTEVKDKNHKNEVKKT